MAAVHASTHPLSPLSPKRSNSVTNYAEVAKASGVSTITKVVFYRDVVGSAYSLLGTVSSSPFKVGFTVSDLDVNTVVNIVAVVTCADGSVLYTVFSGRVREPNLSPTDIRVSVSSIRVRGEPCDSKGERLAVWQVAVRCCVRWHARTGH